MTNTAAGWGGGIFYGRKKGNLVCARFLYVRRVDWVRFRKCLLMVKIYRWSRKGEAAIKCLLVVVDSKSFIGACIYQSWSVMPQSVENNVRGF